MPAGRIIAIDYLCGVIAVLVVLHHSVLAYSRFSHFDRLHYLWSSAPIVVASKWLGFDLIVLFNDRFFMPLMFQLSGLFVWPSLSRKGCLAYRRDRLLRLGLPFVVAFLSVIPLAYYPSLRMTGALPGFGEFWTAMILHGPWPSGPAWFVGVLLPIDLAAAAIHAMLPHPATAGADSFIPRPLRWFRLLVLLSAIGFLPLLPVLGPVRWLSPGPFAVQASRIGLYGVYLLAGVLAGHRGLQCISAVTENVPAWHWPVCSISVSSQRKSRGAPVGSVCRRWRGCGFTVSGSCCFVQRRISPALRLCCDS